MGTRENSDIPPNTNQETPQAAQPTADDIRRAEWWMIRLTGAIVVLTGGLVFVGYLQFRTMSGQLSEMKSGGADTHALAEAAKTLADQAIAQTAAMDAQSRATQQNVDIARQ